MNIHHYTHTNRLVSEIVLQSISAKRAGRSLTPKQIDQTICGFISGAVPDYQAAAWLATIASCGFDTDETVALTQAYLGGLPVRRPTSMPGFLVDKHSTGGVGDKTTLIIAPLLVACGVPVAKLSGRGLGYAGGTIDKLESIAGLRLTLSTEDIARVLETSGMVIAASSDQLAPGDKATYNLRDVTGAVESIPLIAASIVSKKIAFGADALVLDVKTGDGALISDPQGARELAQLMDSIVRHFGMPVRTVLSDMSQPLGRMVGNRIEVAEAIQVLQGADSPGLTQLSLHLAAQMLSLAEPGLDTDQATARLKGVVASGDAFECFARWTREQGADVGALDAIIQSPHARTSARLLAKDSGWISAVPARAVGRAGLAIATGRLTNNDRIDPNSGIEIHVRVGQRIAAGDPLATVYCDQADPRRAVDILSQAICIDPEPAAPIPVLQD